MVSPWNWFHLSRGKTIFLLTGGDEMSVACRRDALWREDTDKHKYTQADERGTSLSKSELVRSCVESDIFEIRSRENIYVPFLFRFADAFFRPLFCAVRQREPPIGRVRLARCENKQKGGLFTSAATPELGCRGVPLP